MLEAPTTCVMGRSYAAGEQRLILQLETGLNNANYELRVIGDLDWLPKVRPGSRSTNIAHSEPEQVLPSYSADLPDKKRVLVMFLSFAEAEQAAKRAALAIADRDWSTSFNLDGFGDALSQLRSCQRGLLVRWGLDPEPWLQNRLARLEGNPGAHFDSEAFSDKLMAGRTSDHITMLLPVGADGTVGRCRTVESAGPAIDAAACARLESIPIKLHPPLDANGVAQASYYFVPLRFE